MDELAIRARLVSRNRRSAGLNVALDESLSAESVQQFLSKADVADSPKQDAAAASSARARLQQRVELDMLYQSQRLQYISAMEAMSKKIAAGARETPLPESSPVLTLAHVDGLPPTVSSPHRPVHHTALCVRVRSHASPTQRAPPWACPSVQAVYRASGDYPVTPHVRSVSTA